MIAADQGGDILGERAAVNFPGNFDHFQVGIGDAGPHAFGKGEQQQNNAILLAGIESPDHAKIHQRQVAIVGQQDIAGMGVTVKYAIDHDLLEVR